jgi:hypothetical protein
MRTLFGVGTPRSLQDRGVALGAMITMLCTLIDNAITAIWSQPRVRTRADRPLFGFLVAESVA